MKFAKFSFIMLTIVGIIFSGNLISQDINKSAANKLPDNYIYQGPGPDANREIIDCPPGAVNENEPCGTDLNGGCNMTIPQYTPITCGIPICGTSYFDGAIRDTDWFLFTATEATKVTLTINSTAQSTVMGKLEQLVPGIAGCENLTGYLDPYVYAPYLTETSFTVILPEAGTYYFFVGLDFNGPVYLCDNGGIQYVLTAECTPVKIPVSNWAIILGVSLILLFAILRFRKIF